MKRWLKISFYLALAGIVCLTLNARAQLTLMGVGGSGESGAYVGPGDIVSGAVTWWGLRCYSAAYVGNVADVYAPLDASHTLITCSTGGVLNETIQPLATTCAVNCTIQTLYDQSGAAACSGPCDAAQAVEALRPIFTLAGLGARPIATSSVKALVSPVVASAPISQPNWVSAVVQTTSSANQGYFGDGTGNDQAGFNGANTAQLYAGAVLTATAATNAWHAIQSVMNGASSDNYVDGVASTGNAGAQTMGTPLHLGVDGFGNSLIGFYTEMGLWNIAPSGGQKSSMNANQHAYWGF